jgi:hypothetical protein
VKVEAEVEALRMVAPLLSNDNEISNDMKVAAAGSTAPSRHWMPQAVNSSSQPEDAFPQEEKVKNWP